MASDPLAIRLDIAISELSAQTSLDGRGSEILAAAITLRDSTGRDRKQALRAMCTAWGVQRQEKISGKWKDRNVTTLQELLTNVVCLAVGQCLAAAPDHTYPEQHRVAEHVSPGSSGTDPEQRCRSSVCWKFECETSVVFAPVRDALVNANSLVALTYAFGRWSMCSAAPRDMCGAVCSEAPHSD